MSAIIFRVISLSKGRRSLCIEMSRAKDLFIVLHTHNNRRRYLFTSVVFSPMLSSVAMDHIASFVKIVLGFVSNQSHVVATNVC